MQYDPDFDPNNGPNMQNNTAALVAVVLGALFMFLLWLFGFFNHFLT
jgi:hypothetical protein